MSRGHKQRQWVKPASAPNSEINVTPLVDVVLVLLIIFMVVTPLLEKDILVRVPETEVEENQPPPEPDDQQIVVQVDKSGAYSINTEQIPASDYVARLKRMLNAKKPDEKVVFFMADDAANYGKLVVALDGARAAGAKILGMATELPQNAVIQGTQATPDGAPPAPPAPPTP
ncbi:biopolymer ExbD/TolR family transporter [Corallococcus coralloides DSM 2259]|uniref:Biopolymer ExbD/TolR family transporter n=1 Tax=Corallococcus coralloides (strain ATCC 25202 / DSM 2259 / NBRC 100086 / M2) TaxID=1144275 RepID=H8MTM0_CORCM|nr:biopolymer transporter ExbD [Corallococcus coralloides]AFE08689.1 biopolymer ExbD/TolR family transporter [Corallococcus coralloides DSM 2259]